MKRIDFNTDWIFYDYQEKKELNVCLPHDATIHTNRDETIRNGWLGGYFYGGNYRYTKNIFIPQDYETKSLHLEFEGVYRNSKVYINDSLVNELVNGYIGFTICLDKYLLYGKDNIIRVEIETPLTDHTRWYQGSGIYRSVNLYIGEKKAYIPISGVKVTTLEYNPAKIKVETDVVGLVDNSEISIEILENEKVIASSFGKNAIIEIHEAKLWNDEEPNLYKARVTINEMDTTLVSFGIRKIEYSAKTGLLINGKETKLYGGCIHADNGILGSVATDATEERRVKTIKEAGFNAIRSAHHPASRALLNACDKYGLYVMDEAFDSWYRMKMMKDFSSSFDREYKKVLNAMTKNCFNHPSVIIYSIGNEIPETGSLKGKRYALSMIEEIKTHDNTRPVIICPSMRLAKDFIFDTPYAEIDEDEYLDTEEKKKADFQHYVKVWTRGLFNLLDVFEYTDERSRQDERVLTGLYEHLDLAGFNYYGEYYENLHEKHPDWVICGTETEGNKLEYHYNLMKKHKYIIGDFIWTLQDHIGEVNCVDMHNPDEKSGDKSYPWLLNYAGILDINGHSYFSLHKYRMIWEREKGIFIAAQPPLRDGVSPIFNNDRETDAIESWSFDGLEGNKTYIDVITDASEAEVFVNGKSLGRKKVEGKMTRFDAIYEKGEVLALGYDDEGKVLYKNKLKTASKKCTLSVQPNKTIISKGGQDFTFLEIDLTDEEGIIKAYPEREVTISVEGEGSLAGFASANYKNEKKYNSNSHLTYCGRLLAAIRSGSNEGDIIITISSKGLESKELIIKSC